MVDYISIIKSEEYKSISVCFYLEQDRIMAIGEKMNAINEEAYMNGYNWEPFFAHYFNKTNPDILIGLEPDPEAGMYVASYTLNADNEARANKFETAVKNLIENEQLIYDFLKEEGGEIEWD